MINEVRNTVLALLNKNNNGYLTPEEFNLLAKQAQLEVFEDYFYDYNAWINKQNARLSNNESADLPRQYLEVIDSFREANKSLTAAAGFFELPTDWYTVDNVFLDSSGTGAYSSLIMADRVSIAQASRVLRSNLTIPTASYPIYSMIEDATTVNGKIKVFPETIGGVAITTGNVRIDYVRYPKSPNWTYQSIGTGGAPLFDDTNVNYQDFELPTSDYGALVIKILEFAGLVIREAAVTQFAQQEEVTDNQQEQ